MASDERRPVSRPVGTRAPRRPCERAHMTSAPPHPWNTEPQCTPSTPPPDGAARRPAETGRAGACAGQGLRTRRPAPVRPLHGDRRSRCAVAVTERRVLWVDRDDQRWIRPASRHRPLGVQRIFPRSLDSHRAGPARLDRLARGQWQIENRLHWVRDVVFDEDHSQIRQGHGPQVMATFRNLAVSLLRRAGRHNIARGLRWAARDTTGTRALGLLGIEAPRGCPGSSAASWTPCWVPVSRGRHPTQRTSRARAVERTA
jgi:hypothetical protein